MQFYTPNVRVSGTGSHVPQRVLNNKELEKQVNTSDDWVRNNLGVIERRIIARGQKTSDLAAEAAQIAVKSAGIDLDEIDIIILATTTPDLKAPSTACLVQEKIGIKECMAFDISAVCSGFLYGMSVGSSFVQMGAKHVLVIGADTFSTVTDWSRRDSVFFGDGAGAIVLSRTIADKGITFEINASSSNWEGFSIPFGGTFKMDGKAVFNSATQVLPNACENVLRMAGVSKEEIDWVVPHQPSVKVLKTCSEKLDIPWDKFLTNMDRYANTSAATVPIVLDENVRNSTIKSGDKLLFAAVGSGWTWGAAYCEWK